LTKGDVITPDILDYEKMAKVMEGVLGMVRE